MANHTVTFQFDNKTISCRAGASIAVALWESGIRVLSHSPKFGRPRGLTCARGHCTSCLMRVDGIPNIRTCETEARQGMTVVRQKHGTFIGPGLQKIRATGDNLFPVGFYFKWFTRPPAVSRFFLNQMRSLSGVGNIAESAPPRPLPISEASSLADDLYGFRKIIVGGGPSGLEAALASTEPVLLLDEHSEIGGQRGQALRKSAAALGDSLERFPVLAQANRRLANLVSEFSNRKENLFQGGIRAVAGYDPGGLLLRRSNELANLDFQELVWAGGAMDSLGLFAGNDNPGLIGPRALFRLLLRDNLDIAGKQVLIIGSGLDFWLSATILDELGAGLALVVTESGAQSEISAAVDAKWQLTTGLELANIRPHGENRLATTLIPKQSTPGPMYAHLQMESDLVVICGPGKPNFSIPAQMGVKMSLRPERGGLVASNSGENKFTQRLSSGASLTIVGQANGILSGQPGEKPDEDALP